MFLRTWLDRSPAGTAKWTAGCETPRRSSYRREISILFHPNRRASVDPGPSMASAAPNVPNRTCIHGSTGAGETRHRSKTAVNPPARLSKKVLSRADRAIAEGREAIQNLHRSSTKLSNELSQAMAALGEELAGDKNGENRSAAFLVG